MPSVERVLTAKSPPNEGTSRPLPFSLERAEDFPKTSRPYFIRQGARNCSKGLRQPEEPERAIRKGSRGLDRGHNALSERRDFPLDVFCRRTHICAFRLSVTLVFPRVPKQIRGRSRPLPPNSLFCRWIICAVPQATVRFCSRCNEGLVKVFLATPMAEIAVRAALAAPFRRLRQVPHPSRSRSRVKSILPTSVIYPQRDEILPVQLRRRRRWMTTAGRRHGNNEKARLSAGLARHICLPDIGRYQACSVFTRLARRETFREAVFLCRTPFWAARTISGSA